MGYIRYGLGHEGAKGPGDSNLRHKENWTYQKEGEV